MDIIFKMHLPVLPHLRLTNLFEIYLILKFTFSNYVEIVCLWYNTLWKGAFKRPTPINSYTVKKLAVFLSPAGMSLTKLSLAERDIPAWNGKTHR